MLLYTQLSAGNNRGSASRAEATAFMNIFVRIALIQREHQTKGRTLLLVACAQLGWVGLVGTN